MAHVNEDDTIFPSTHIYPQMSLANMPYPLPPPPAAERHHYLVGTFLIPLMARG